ncbi:hypothetical protein LDENG_00132660 [Lucifuga dentata]|nr:hypothetical protein LDENG_00132660 [Lucifuga dentata]
MIKYADHLVMFASLGDHITLPCVIPSVSTCSSISWNMAGEFGSVTQVVAAGRITASKSHRLSLMQDCSLQINHLEIDDARLYTCNSGTFNSSVSLEILQITQTKTAEKGKTELHCSLNTYKGHVPSCHHGGIHIGWLTEGNTHINGDRFHVQNPSNCFSKMTIKMKLTDHHRKWKCQLTQKDTVKTTTSYTTTVQDGIQEVFAVVGESVSFSCGDTSSLSVGGGMQWDLGGRSEHISPGKNQLPPFHMNEDSSLVISKVSALQSGNYKCSQPTGDKKVINKIRLHTLDITSESGPGGETLTLTCVLLCAAVQCEQDFNLTWTGNTQYGWQSSLIQVNNSLISKLFLPDLQMRPDQFSCSVTREGVIMASKKWHFVNTVQMAMWLVLPLGLLICVITGGICMYMKRKHNKDAGNESPNIGMTHLYETIEDVNNEELLQQSQAKRRAATSDSFYDLLQAVN